MFACLHEFFEKLKNGKNDKKKKKQLFDNTVFRNPIINEKRANMHAFKFLSPIRQ